MGLVSIFLVFAVFCALGEAQDVAYCGLTNADPFADRIVGGIETIPHEFPWMVKMRKKGNNFYCGASLISDRYVLTAGHCVSMHKNGFVAWMELATSGWIRIFNKLIQNLLISSYHNFSSPTEPRAVRGNMINYYIFNAADITVELGSWATKESNPTVIRQVVSITNHPEYDAFVSNGIMIQTNDIAVVKIEPVVFTNNIMPICLPNPGDRIRDGAMVVVAGWGSTNTETVDQKKTHLPDAMMKTILTKISWNDCRTNPNVGMHLDPINRLNDMEIFCLVGNNTDSCRGDSGGPAVVYTPGGFVVAGIVSWGIGCNQLNYPAAYTQVSSYVDFIRANTLDGIFLPRKPY